MAFSCKPRYPKMICAKTFRLLVKQAEYAKYSGQLWWFSS